MIYVNFFQIFCLPVELDIYSKLRGHTSSGSRDFRGLILTPLPQMQFSCLEKQMPSTIYDNLLTGITDNLLILLTRPMS